MYGSSGPPQPSPAQSRAISAGRSGAVLKPGMEKFCCLVEEPVPVFELPHSAFYFWIIWSQNFPWCNFCSLHGVHTKTLGSPFLPPQGSWGNRKIPKIPSHFSLGWGSSFHLFRVFSAQLLHSSPDPAHSDVQACSAPGAGLSFDKLSASSLLQPAELPL